jgi:hypothetical protein
MAPHVSDIGDSMYNFGFGYSPYGFQGGGYGGRGYGYGGMPSPYGIPYTPYQPFGTGFNLGFNFGLPGFGAIPGGMPYSYPQPYFPMFQGGGYQAPGQEPQVPGGGGGGGAAVVEQPPYQAVQSIYPEEPAPVTPAEPTPEADLARILRVHNRVGMGESGKYYTSDAARRQALGDQVNIDMFNKIYGTYL